VAYAWIGPRKGRGCGRGYGNDLSQVEGAQEVPENSSFPGVVPETEIDFHLEQEREIIPTGAGVRPPHIGRVGRLVGTLQGTVPRKCGKARGTAFSVWVGCAPVRDRKDSSRGVWQGVATQRIFGSAALRVATSLRQNLPGKGPT
jgi:hypothetical protein